MLFNPEVTNIKTYTVEEIDSDGEDLEEENQQPNGFDDQGNLIHYYIS